MFYAAKTVIVATILAFTGQPGNPEAMTGPKAERAAEKPDNPQTLPLSELPPFNRRKEEYGCLLWDIKGYALIWRNRDQTDPEWRGGQIEPKKEQHRIRKSGKYLQFAPPGMSLKRMFIVKTDDDYVVAFNHWEDAANGIATLTFDLNTGLAYYTNTHIGRKDGTVLSNTSVLVCR